METRDSAPSTTPLPYSYSPLYAAAVVLFTTLLLAAIAVLVGVIRITPRGPCRCRQRGR